MIPMDRPVTLRTSPVHDVRSDRRWQRIDLGDDQWISIHEDGSYHAHGLGPVFNPHAYEDLCHPAD